MSNSTTQDVFFLTNLRNESSSLRLVKLIQRQKTSFSRQLCLLRHPLLDDFCTTTRHFMSNSTSRDAFFKTTLCIESSSRWQSCTTTRHFTSDSTSQDVFFKTSLHIESSSCWPSCTTTRYFMSNSTTQDVFFLDKFVRWVVPLLLTSCTMTRLFTSSSTNSTSQDIFFQDNFAYWVILFLTIFAGRLVTLCQIQQHKTSFSWQIYTMSRPLVVSLARRLVTLRLIQHHKTPFSLICHTLAVCRRFSLSLLRSDWDLARICYICHCLVDFVPIK